MSQERVMLLIDADNLSLDVMEQAVRLLLNQHGGLHVRRAYCTAESAVANQLAFKRLGIKPMVNLATGKNSTDIAMAVDAIDLVLAERPDVVVIASSDSDFAPLVQRLREKGCVVRGIGQKGKVGDETQDVYDDYTVIEHRSGATTKAAPRAAAKTARAPRTSRARASSAQAAPSPAPTPAPTPTSTPSSGLLAVPSPSSKTAAVRKLAGGRVAAKTAARRGAVPPPPAADTSAIFEAIVEGALDVEADEVGVMHEPPAAKTTKARARKSATAKLRGSAADAAASAPVPVPYPAAVAPAATVAPARTRGRKAKASQTVGEVAVPDDEVPVGPIPAASGAAAPADPSTAATPRATLQAVMACLPELARGQSLALNVAVQRLREARLLGKNSSSLKLFSQLSENFELLPARNPSQVRLRS